MYFHPGDPPYSACVAKNRAWRNYCTLVAEKGPDHPATRAAWGRVLFHEGSVPQAIWTTATEVAPDVHVIAWHRESGSILGFRNRSERKHHDHELGLTTDENESTIAP